MKLPENYSSWVEFAKECGKYTPGTEIVFKANEVISEKYNINAVKAKAFDEVMELALAAKKKVSSLTTGWGEDSAVMTRFLILLTDGK